MRAYLKIVGYVAMVMVGGALLAPPLWWLGQWGIRIGLVPGLRPFAFDKYFNRAALILAVALLPWLVRSLRVTGVDALGLAPNPKRGHDTLLGLVLALGGFGVTTACLHFAGALQLRPATSWRAWGLAALAAMVVGPLEEVLFRGVFLGVLRRTMRNAQALFCLSLLFAGLHFLRPNPAMPKFDAVTLASGLQLLPHLLWEYTQPSRLWASGITLFVMATVLGYSVLKTRSLYLAIGLHAGWVFGVKALTLTGVAHSRSGFWLGDDWRSGAAPLGLMLATGAIVHWLLRGRGESPASNAADDNTRVVI